MIPSPSIEVYFSVFCYAAKAGFFFSQFCDVAEVAIIYKMIWPDLAAD
jgi:hypothetical protein